MIFDESFAHIDDKRLAILLRIVATQEQSIILTSNSRDADIMRALGEFKADKDVSIDLNPSGRTIARVYSYVNLHNVY